MAAAKSDCLARLAWITVCSGAVNTGACDGSAASCANPAFASGRVEWLTRCMRFASRGSGACDFEPTRVFMIWRLSRPSVLDTGSGIVRGNEPASALRQSGLEMNFDTTAGELTNTSGDTAMGACTSICELRPAPVRSSVNRVAHVLESGIHTAALSGPPLPPVARICSTLLDGSGVTLTSMHLPSALGLVAVQRFAIVCTGSAMPGAASTLTVTLPLQPAAPLADDPPRLRNTTTPAAQAAASSRIAATTGNGVPRRPLGGFECRPAIPSQ